MKNASRLLVAELEENQMAIAHTSEMEEHAVEPSVKEVYKGQLKELEVQEKELLDELKVLQTLAIEK